jgi:hypothetical protein
MSAEHEERLRGVAQDLRKLADYYEIVASADRQLEEPQIVEFSRLIVRTTQSLQAMGTAMFEVLDEILWTREQADGTTQRN